MGFVDPLLFSCRFLQITGHLFRPLMYLLKMSEVAMLQNLQNHHNDDLRNVKSFLIIDMLLLTEGFYDVFEVS